MTRFVTTTNRAGGYRHESTLGGKLETTRTIGRHIIGPVTLLAGCGVVAVLSIVALGV